MKRSIIAAVFLSLGLVAAGAGEIEVSIRYYDKQVYYAEKDEESSAHGDWNPVQIQVTISNKTPETCRFKLADERAFSVDFPVFTISNRRVELATSVQEKRTTDEAVFFREMAIESGESLSFTEDLRDYAVLESPGSYVVQAIFYPELFTGKNASNPATEPLLSNRLPLILYPAPLRVDGKPQPPLDLKTGAVLVREKLPPDQVVEYVLSARQKGEWEKFFLYMDLEKMLLRDGARARRYNAESEQGRRRMIAEYREMLETSVLDGEISTIPIEFEVVKTTYKSNTGKVEVVEKFRSGTYTERKSYTYDLLRRNDIWMIINYSVNNLGTE